MKITKGYPVWLTTRAIVMAWLCIGILSGQTRGFKIRTPTGEELRPFGESWALIIGIDDYKYPRIPDLNNAVKDARSVAQMLIETQGFVPDKVIQLYNRDATKKGILEAFYDIDEKIEKEDRVLIYYAGHGHNDQSGRREKGYILPHDTDLSRLKRTAISAQELNDFSKEFNARHVFFVMDACYAGMLHGTRATPMFDPKVAGYVKSITSRFARQALTAGQAKQTVRDDGPGGHSVFTYHLLRGIRDGEADENNNGVITATELSVFIKPKVRDVSDGDQDPRFGQLSLDDGGEFVFLPPPKMFTLKIESNVGGAEFYIDGEGFGTAPGSADLRSGIYNVELRKTGYKPFATKVKLFGDNQLYASLEPALFDLAVMSNPDAAEVYIGGILQNQKTNYIQKGFKTGTYVVEIVKEGFEPWKKTVNVTGNKSINATLVTLGAKSTEDTETTVSTETQPERNWSILKREEPKEADTAILDEVIEEEKSILSPSMEEKLEMFEKQKKSRFVASSLAPLFGIGHFYTGHWLKGLGFGMGQVVSLLDEFANEDGAGITVYGILTVWAMLNASKQVRKYNNNLYWNLIENDKDIGLNIIPRRDGVAFMLSYHF